MRVPRFLLRAPAASLLVFGALMLVLPLFVYAGDIPDAGMGVDVGTGVSTNPGAGASFAQAIGIFNVFVGLMLTVALFTYGWGFILWFCRLGTWPSYRTEAVKIMEWSVVILFVLVVLMAIVQFFQNHPRQATYLLSLIVGVIVIAVIVYLAAHSGGGEKKEANPKH